MPEVYEIGDIPTSCPTCGGERTLDRDMTAEEGSPEWYSWCDSCADGYFKSEEPTKSVSP